MMLNLSFTVTANGNRLFGLLLTLSLLFAAQHLAMHDIDSASGGLIGHHECQLNHVPCAQLPVPSLGLQLLAPVLLLETPYAVHQAQAFFYSWRARAPPPA